MAKSAALTRVRTLAGVTEYRLQNGMRVLHRIDRSAPLCAVMVVYHVGSRNEALGHTGSTHILEHLLFKDTDDFNKKNGNSVSNLLDHMGAVSNATTWTDRTNYYELIPKENLPEVLRMEASRMRTSRFSAADLATEMTVVRNEYERSRNNPGDLLDEAVFAMAFMSHPYHHPTIGWKEDIEAATVERLREFYDRFYHPNNATLIVIGDVTKERLVDEIVKTFGKLPASQNPIPGMFIIEPPQEGPRSLQLRRPGDTTLATLGYRVPRALDARFPTARILAQILAGGLSSRLEQTLVAEGKAVSVTPFVPAFVDESLFTLTAQAAPGVSVDTLLSAMRSATKAVATKGISTGELARAKAQLAASAAYARDGYLNEAFVFGEAVAAGDWTLAIREKELLEAVSKKMCLALAREMFREENEVVGTLIPKTA